MLTTQEQDDLAQSAHDNEQAEAGRAEYQADVHTSRIARLKAQIEPLAAVTRPSPSQLDKLDQLQDELKVAESGLETESEEGEGADSPEPEITADSAPAILPVIKPPKRRPKQKAEAEIIAPATPSGPLYLLLSSNGKYKELAESQLQTEAADMLKDPQLRLVKGVEMKPQISFNEVA